MSFFVVVMTEDRGAGHAEEPASVGCMCPSRIQHASDDSVDSQVVEERDQILRFLTHTVPVAIMWAQDVLPMIAHGHVLATHPYHSV